MHLSVGESTVTLGWQEPIPVPLLGAMIQHPLIQVYRDLTEHNYCK